MKSDEEADDDEEEEEKSFILFQVDENFNNFHSLECGRSVCTRR